MTTPTNPMDLPAGLTCGDCAHFKPKCSRLIASLTGKETRCDWSPSRFRVKAVSGGAPTTVDGIPLSGGELLTFGELAGLTYAVYHNGVGYRNGYVLVPHGHPWYGLDYDDVDRRWPSESDRSLTFSARDRNGRGWWLGFDTCGSRPDPTLSPEPALAKAMEALAGPAPIAGQDHVEAECRNLCRRASLIHARERLRDAAPDLLAACEFALVAASQMPKPGLGEVDWPRIAGELSAAIAKATNPEGA